MDWVAAVMFVGFSGLHALVFGHPRYRLPLVPLLCGYAAWAWFQRRDMLSGRGNGPRWVAAVVGLALVGWFFLSARSARSALYIGLGCVAGGALGNLVDRVVLGGVRDFIDLHWMDKAHWPVFNVADASITVGTFIIALTLIFRR